MEDNIGNREEDNQEVRNQEQGNQELGNREEGEENQEEGEGKANQKESPVSELPRPDMFFPSESAALAFYNRYAGMSGFSVRTRTTRKDASGRVIYKKFVCSKEGFRQPDKRDGKTKNERAQTRTGCGAFMSVKPLKESPLWIIYNLELRHNHPLIHDQVTYMLPSQRSISETHSIEIDMAEDSGIPLRNAYELMGKEVGGRECLGFTRVDHKNCLRTRRQRELACGEATCILTYLHDQSRSNPSFFSKVQTDNEEQITNIFWADARMVVDYGHFGDVVSFDTTYKINRESRPFAVFVGFNNHREVVVFGGALMYDETAESFIWLFEAFLEAMCDKHPRTILTDQDAAMAKAIACVFPNTCHRLCKWHLMQNAVKHLSSVFWTVGGVRMVLGKFFDEIEEEEDFLVAWDAMLEEHGLQGNSWLQGIFDLRKKWARRSGLGHTLPGHSQQA